MEIEEGFGEVVAETEAVEEGVTVEVVSVVAGLTEEVVVGSDQ